MKPFIAGIGESDLSYLHMYYTSKSTVALKWGRFQKKPSVVLSLLWHTVRLNLKEGGRD